MALRLSWLSTFRGITLTNDQAAAGPVGSVEVITSALLSTAAQADVEGQETPVTPRPLPPATAFQLPAVGAVEVIISPALAVTHSPVVGQETPVSSPGPAGLRATDQAAGRRSGRSS